MCKNLVTNPTINPPLPTFFLCYNFQVHSFFGFCYNQLCSLYFLILVGSLLQCNLMLILCCLHCINSKKILVYLKGTLYLQNIHSRKGEGSYNSLTLGRMLSLGPPPTTCDLCMFRFMLCFTHCKTLNIFWFMITLLSCFMTGNVLRCEIFSKCGVGVYFDLILGPLFYVCPHLRVLPYTKNWFGL
jgi:hypothetical protein